MIYLYLKQKIQIFKIKIQHTFKTKQKKNQQKSNNNLII